MMNIYGLVSIYYYDNYDEKFGGRWENFVVGLELTIFVSGMLGLIHLFVLLLFPVPKSLKISVLRSIIVALFVTLSWLMLDLVNVIDSLNFALHIALPCLTSFIVLYLSNRTV